MPDRHIFRMTYYRNVEQFLKDGAVFAKNHQPMQLCYRTSYGDIVQRRATTAFQTPCGGVVNDFVPFYFSPATAMAGAIHMGHVSLIDPNDVNLGVASMDDIVFLVCRTKNVSKAGLAFWFTNVACNSLALKPLYESDLSKLASHIDWSLFDENPKMAHIPEIGYSGVCKWFKDFDNPIRYRNRKAMRMAEFMVKDPLPLNFVDCIITKHQHIKQQIDTWMHAYGQNIPVYVKKGCYF